MLGPEVEVALRKVCHDVHDLFDRKIAHVLIKLGLHIIPSTFSAIIGMHDSP